MRAVMFAMGLAMLSTACAPTIRVKVDPINIYAKLDADVRVRLDKEVQTLIATTPTCSDERSDHENLPEDRLRARRRDGREHGRGRPGPERRRQGRRGRRQ